MTISAEVYKERGSAMRHALVAMLSRTEQWACTYGMPEFPFPAGYDTRRTWTLFRTLLRDKTDSELMQVGPASCMLEHTGIKYPLRLPLIDDACWCIEDTVSWMTPPPWWVSVVRRSFRVQDIVEKCCPLLVA